MAVWYREDLIRNFSFKKTFSSGTEIIQLVIEDQGVAIYGLSLKKDLFHFNIP